jgi:hypothetical protein
MAEWDYERAEEKRKELRNLLNEYLSKQGFLDSHISAIEQRIFSNGIYLSPPEKPKMMMHLITMDSFHSSSESTKPGNIKLNLKDFLESIGTGVMTFAGGLAYPWLYLVGFTLLWKQLWDCATIEIDEPENKVLWSLWELKKGSQQMTFDNVLEKIVAISQHYDLPKMKKGEIKLALDNLEKINAIEKRDASEYRIIEWIRIPYR